MSMKRKSKFKRIKTPTILQIEAVECAAAALAIVLSYFGFNIALEKLREDLGVNRDGSNAKNLYLTAQKYGLEVEAYKKEPEQLIEMPFPMILFWEFNHFLVLEGIKNDTIYLNDPATGPRKITWNELDNSFTGVVLTFKKGLNFKKGGSRPNIISGLAARLKGYRSALIYFIITVFFLVLMGLVTPAFSRYFMDVILVKQLARYLRPLLFGMGIVCGLTIVLTYCQQYFLAKMQTNLSTALSGKFFWHLLKLPINFFSQRYAGELSLRVAINDRIASLLTGKIATNIINIFFILFYILVMLKYDVVLTSIGIAAAIFNIAFLQIITRLRVDLNLRYNQEYGKLVGASASGIAIIETLKANGNEPDFFSRWAGLYAKSINAQQKLLFSSAYLNNVPTTIFQLINNAILILGSLRIMQGDLSIGMFVAFQGLMGNFMNPVNQLVSLGSDLQNLQSYMYKIDDIYNNEIDPTLRAKKINTLNLPAKLSGYIEIKNLSFGYSKLEAPLIENFNLLLKPGSRVAIIGGTGSGKSTIAKIIAGLYQPWSGEIFFDGIDKLEITREIITNSLAMVNQEIVLFEGSIRDNLTLWDSSVTDEDLIAAAKCAEIHSTILTRKGDYNSIIDENGRNFSGGQRQRLEIARALVNNPSLLILDEATSALDSKTEKNIDDNLRARGITCIIVAHRLSTIRDCDEIIVLDNGKVVQRGTHEQLKDLDGPYKKLIRIE